MYSSPSAIPEGAGEREIPTAGSRLVLAVSDSNFIGARFQSNHKITSACAEADAALKSPGGQKFPRLLP